MEPASGDAGESNLFKKFLKNYWKIIFALIWFVLLTSILVFFPYPEAKCAYVILIMAAYWISECFPVSITSLIPVVLFPVLGVLSTGETCACYMNDTIMVFVGGLVLALAIEHSNLHLRIALGVMRLVGCTHSKLLGGLCVVTTFVSMWVSNTAATAMMIPIIFAILGQLEQVGFGKVYHENVDDLEDTSSKTPTNVTKAYLLGAAYCATFGGTGTLVGTASNLTFKGIYESIFPGAESINFTLWLAASFPQMVVNSFLTWFYLRVAYMGFLRPKSKDAQAAKIGSEGEAVTNEIVREKYAALGPITFHELAVATLFTLCIFLWLFRKPGFVRGWSEMITDIDIMDSTPVIFTSILMFFIPKEPTFLHSCSRDPAKRPKKYSEGLITWNVIQTKMPWGLMFLLGGGFAISKGSIVSGLAKNIGEFLIPLKNLPFLLMLFLLCLFVGTITEFTSNVGIANITLPVIAQLCVAIRVHPLYLMVPATLMCSFSFRLPVGTPPNALIHTAGNISTKTLMMSGMIPSLYSLIVQIILFPTWGAFIYGISIDDFPSWAEHKEEVPVTEA